MELSGSTSGRGVKSFNCQPLQKSVVHTDKSRCIQTLCQTHFVGQFLKDSTCTARSELRVGREPKFLFALGPGTTRTDTSSHSKTPAAFPINKYKVDETQNSSALNHLHLTSWALRSLNASTTSVQTKERHRTLSKHKLHKCVTQSPWLYTTGLFTMWVNVGWLQAEKSVIRMF